MKDSAWLNTTALCYPRPVYAPTAVGFVMGALGLGGSVAAGTALGAGIAAGAAFAATTLGGIVINAAIGIGLSVIAAALQPAPEIPKPSARMVNYAQGLAYAEYALGRTRKGGPIGFTGAAGKYRWYVPILAAHPIEGVVQHYLDERAVEFGEDGFVTTTGYSLNHERAWMRMLHGDAGQVAAPELMAAFPGQITAAHDFKGLAGAVIRAKKVSPERMSDVYPRGREWDFTPVIEGCNAIWDPRSETRGYSNNAALVIAWWLTEVHGLSVDWEDVAIEADACDPVITDRYGVSGPKWTINGTLSDAQDFETQRAQLAGACDAFFFEKPSGEVGFYVGRWIAPDVTLTDADFEAIEISSGQTGSDAISAVVPEYIEPENAWREWSAGAWVVDAEGNQTHRDTPQLFMVNWHNQACRIAKRIGHMKAAEYQLSGTIGAIGYELQGKRFFRVRHEELGIDACFEIGKLVLEATGVFSITANSVAPAHFDFDSATEEPARPETKASEISDTSEVDGVTGVSAQAIGFGRIRVEWDEPDDLYQVRVRLTRASDGVVTYHQETGTGFAEIWGLVPGETYLVDVALESGVISSAGVVVGAPNWAPDPALSVVVIGDLPAAPGSIVAAAEPGRAVLGGMASPFTVGVRVYHAATDDFSAAVQVGDMIPVTAGAPFVITVGDPAAVDLVTRGDFAADLDWTKGAGWSIGAGAASHTAGAAGDLSQPVGMAAGVDYRLTLTATAAAGTLSGVLIGDTDTVGTAISADGTWREVLTAPANPTDLALRASSGFSGTVDAVSLVAVTAEAAATGFYWLVPVSLSGDAGAETLSQYLVIP